MAGVDRVRVAAVREGVGGARQEVHGHRAAPADIDRAGWAETGRGLNQVPGAGIVPRCRVIGGGCTGQEEDEQGHVVVYARLAPRFTVAA